MGSKNAHSNNNASTAHVTVATQTKTGFRAIHRLEMLGEMEVNGSASPATESTDFERIQLVQDIIFYLDPVRISYTDKLSSLLFCTHSSLFACQNIINTQRILCTSEVHVLDYRTH